MLRQGWSVGSLLDFHYNAFLACRKKGVPCVGWHFDSGHGAIGAEFKMFENITLVIEDDQHTCSFYRQN